jgi:hypothetical protein
MASGSGQEASPAPFSEHRNRCSFEGPPGDNNSSSIKSSRTCAASRSASCAPAFPKALGASTSPLSKSASETLVVNHSENELLAIVPSQVFRELQPHLKVREYEQGEVLAKTAVR